MADLDDVRRVALALPGVVEERDGERTAFSVERDGKSKALAWTWMERVEPGKPRVPRPGVLAVRVAGLDDKEALLAANSAAFFTEPHYDGFPAVLVRLPELVTDAWRVQAAPAALVREHGGA